MIVAAAQAVVAAFATDIVFFMREVTQAECRCINKLGGVFRDDCTARTLVTIGTDGFALHNGMFAIP